ncbi:hypothetical protein HGP16_32495 [Rhizobium sp. P40RR-XXII]|uniref:hypothetical protein n=1 Tax=unclassified Rhizobium TaxID=2613769 RepID=UPI0014571602|nr:MULTISPECIES: hypothetical protein [unclassified Rhizobium]NLR89358.1 hypothetical protein [Rhizobium sp. P28RR-XV]NLS21220.1 hypothetical protein [Rhizobium sp. P40RR-XXII]
MSEADNSLTTPSRDFQALWNIPIAIEAKQDGRKQGHGVCDRCQLVVTAREVTSLRRSITTVGMCHANHVSLYAGSHLSRCVIDYRFVDVDHSIDAHMWAIWDVQTPSSLPFVTMPEQRGGTATINPRLLNGFLTTQQVDRRPQIGVDPGFPNICLFDIR